MTTRFEPSGLENVKDKVVVVTGVSFAICELDLSNLSYPDRENMSRAL